MEIKEQANTHGGVRHGAGRPRSKYKKPNILVSFRVSGDDVSRLQEAATAEGMTVHAWCQEVVRKWLAE